MSFIEKKTKQQQQKKSCHFSFKSEEKDAYYYSSLKKVLIPFEQFNIGEFKSINGRYKIVAWSVYFILLTSLYKHTVDNVIVKETLILFMYSFLLSYFFFIWNLSLFMRIFFFFCCLQWQWKVFFLTWHACSSNFNIEIKSKFFFIKLQYGK